MVSSKKGIALWSFLSACKPRAEHVPQWFQPPSSSGVSRRRVSFYIDHRVLFSASRNQPPGFHRPELSTAPAGKPRGRQAQRLELEGHAGAAVDAIVIILQQQQVVPAGQGLALRT